MSPLVISVEAAHGGPEAVVRPDGKDAGWRCSLPDYDAAVAASLRWILEDYPRLLPSESRELAKVLAHAKLSAFGRVLHAAVFGEDGSRLREMSIALPELDIVFEDSAGLTRQWPWELMNCDGAALVHHSRSFVRRVALSADATGAPSLGAAGPLRVLMVISRPAGLKDIPFRTVASRVLRAVAGKDVEIEVLRPSTLAALENRLLETKQGKAFDVIHFDGHGKLVDTAGGARGALWFETADDRGAWVTGAKVAAILKSAGVPVLLLNACNSAQAPVAAPKADEQATTVPAAAASLAEIIAATGIEVVAMSHAVHVRSAAHIVADVYAMLAAHRDVADAVRFARRRWIDDRPAIDLEEGHAIVRHFGRQLERRAPAPEVAYPDMRGRRTPSHARLPKEFESAEIVVGTDDAVFTLERRLRHGGLVELCGLRGSGKTALLLELGRWLVATRGAQPEAVHYIDLAREPLELPRPALTPAIRQFVLFDNARVAHGDPLRSVSAWDPARVASLRASIDALVTAGAHVIVATCAPLLDIDEEQRMSMLPIELEDLRELAAMRTGDEVQVPDLALLWTGGNPGSVDFMIDWARGGHLADPARTWQTLRELGLGSFEHAPLPVPVDAPLALSKPAAMFEPAYLAPWVVALSPTRMILDEELLKGFGPEFLSSYLGAVAQPGGLATIEQAGLVCRTDKRGYDVHPLATCLMMTPVTTAHSATQQEWQTFALVAQVTAHIKTFQLGREGGALLGAVRDPIESPWWLPSLIQSWRYMGELAQHHGLYLALGRRIRERLLDADLGAYWDLAFADMQRIFERYPPDASADGHQSRLQWISLQTLEAKRAGNSERELAFAREAAELSAADGRTQMVDAFDAQMKLGRAEREPKRKKAAFERAIELADRDTLRTATAELELARILRTESAIRDLAKARDYGESALKHFRGYKGLADPARIVEATLSLSLVYFDIFQTDRNRSGAAAQRGEALCKESLQLATASIHKANAAYNLGLWRSALGDAADAEKLFLTALSAYDALGEREYRKNKARYQRLLALNELIRKGVDRTLEARALAVDLLPRLLRDPQAPDAWKIETHRIGEALGAAPQPLSADEAEIAVEPADASGPDATKTAQEPRVTEQAGSTAMTTRQLAQREPSGSVPADGLTKEQFVQFFALAEQARANGDLDAARDLLHGLITIDRRSSSAWTLLGRVERDAALIEDARAAFAFALGLEPNNKELAMELARIDQALQA
jgi:hypothetical protein